MALTGGTAAFDAASAADAVRRGAATDHDLELVSEAQLLVRFLHPGVTAAEVHKVFSTFGPLTFVRVEISTYAGTPKEPRIGLEYNAARIGYKYGADAAATRVAFDGEDILHSGPLHVTFASGLHHDIIDDDDANDDFDESDLAQPDDPESDDMDFDDFDDF